MKRTKDAPPQPLRLDQTSARYRELLRALAAECTPLELQRLKLYDLAAIQKEQQGRPITPRKEME